MAHIDSGSQSSDGNVAEPHSKESAVSGKFDKHLQTSECKTCKARKNVKE